MRKDGQMGFLVKKASDGGVSHYLTQRIAP